MPRAALRVAAGPVLRVAATPALRVAGRLALRIAAGLAAAWREGVRVQELMLSGPWEREGELRWRRELGAWRLVGSTPPLVPSGVERRTTGPEACEADR